MYKYVCVYTHIHTHRYANTLTPKIFSMDE
jgi:hypothetical protein